VARGIAVLINRPLNAIVGGRMLRLANFVAEGTSIDLEAQLKTVGNLEAEWRRRLAPEIRTTRGSLSPDDFFRWTDQLQALPRQLENLDQWDHIEGQMILPQVASLIKVLDQSLDGELARLWQSWRDRYVDELTKLLGEFRRQAATRSQKQSTAIAAAIDPLLPAERRGESLSRKALWVLASTPGVSSVLNGMRRPSYVEDSLGILAWPPLPYPLPVYEAVQGLRLPR
jgi:hypothetical protein